MTSLAATRAALGALAIILAACGSNGGQAAEDVTPSPDRDASPATGEDASAPSPDGAVVDAGLDADPQSRCQVTATTVFCEHHVTALVAGTVSRDVYWQTPSTPPPPGGYPVVVVYQGSFGGPRLTWAELTPSAPFGGFHQGRLHATLLDHGFTVVAPEAAAGVAWQTNSGIPYDATTDKKVIDALLVAIGAGEYGPADTSRLYATGISSGGYMTSRMAVSHAGTFRALAIQSASYATCLGPVCSVPSSLPADHPPTLFLHGALDATVPLSTAERYHDQLLEGGHVTSKIVDPAAGHEWLAVAPERILGWFTAH